MNERQLPPRFFIRLFRWFCHPKLSDHIEGDLLESYSQQLRTSGKRKADLKFIIDVLLLFRPGIIRPAGGYHHLNSYGMLKNYVKIGWRTLAKHKMYSSIKIGGFAVGIAACMLIALFIRHELSYDRHYRAGARIFRIYRESTFNGQKGVGAHFPHPFAAALLEDYPEIELAGRYNPAALFGAGSNEVRRADKLGSSFEDKLVFADQSLLDIFEVPFVEGNPRKALTEPNTIVITKSKAEKYFPGESPLGKILILNNDDSKQFTVSGVIKDFPETMHFRYDFIISMANREFYEGEASNWQNSNYLTYIRLREGADAQVLQQKLSSMIPKYFLPQAVAQGSVNAINWVKSLRLHVQPVHDIYLNNDQIHEGLDHGDIRYIWLFGAIASFILLIAGVNFINLSTAKSANRAREVGVRKVAGSQRNSLIIQFLTESFLFTFFSVALGLLLAWQLLPFFNMLLARSLDFPWDQWWLAPVLIAGTLVIGVLAGFYPALYLSSFKPILVLKGAMSRGSKSSSMRSVLVVFQFTISIALIMATVVVDRQMSYILNKNLGFDRDQVVLLHGTHTLGGKISAFKGELLKLPNVVAASVSDFLPIEGATMNGGGWRVEGMRREDAVNGQQWSVDEDYVRTLGLKITRGRDFTTMASDSQAVIVNETLVRSLNLKEPVGERITNYLGSWTIVGVVEDFHFESMKQAIRPLGMYIRPSVRSIAVKVDTEDMQEVIQSVTGLWNTFSPNQEIRYAFLDQSYARMYDDLRRIGDIFRLFALLAIIVASLGLFALSSFMVEQRGKEISIRLVLGASVENIFQMLTSNFVKLVVIAFLFAMPIAGYLMQKWLQDFSYRINITADIFMITGATALLIALCTVSFQSIRAALVNPATNLKSE
jgi:putative ABC transport system permease protein